MIRIIYSPKRYLNVSGHTLNTMTLYMIDFPLTTGSKVGRKLCLLCMPYSLGYSLFPVQSFLKMSFEVLVYFAITMNQFPRQRLGDTLGLGLLKNLICSRTSVHLTYESFASSAFSNYFRKFLIGLKRSQPKRFLQLRIGRIIKYLSVKRLFICHKLGFQLPTLNIQFLAFKVIAQIFIQHKTSSSYSFVISLYTFSKCRFPLMYLEKKTNLRKLTQFATEGKSTHRARYRATCWDQ